MRYSGNVIFLPQFAYRPVEAASGTRDHISRAERPDSSAAFDLPACVANELITTATWIAAATGIINRCFLDRQATSPKFFYDCLPPDPVLHLGLKAMATRPEEAALVYRAEQLCLYLAAARQALMEALGDQEIAARDRRQLQLKVCDLWQAAADIALLGLYAIEDVVGLSRIGFGAENMSALCKALIAARSGQSPFQKGGVPQLPKWAERRQSRRTTVNMMAELTVEGRSRDVLVTNASFGGLGLEYASGLKEGELVSVRLQNGRCFIGKVRWCIGTRAGLSFRKSLRPNDPLLSG